MQVHAENPEWTCFEQAASLDVKSFFGFESAVEKLAVKQYSHNLAKGKEILEYFIDELIKSGVTYIPPFSPTTSTTTQPASESTTLAAEPENGVARAPAESTSTSVETKSPNDSAIDVSHKGAEEESVTEEGESEHRRPSAVGKFAAERRKSSQQTPTRSVGSDEIGRRRSVTRKLTQGQNGEARRASSFDDG